MLCIIQLNEYLIQLDIIELKHKNLHYRKPQTVGMQFGEFFSSTGRKGARQSLVPGTLCHPIPPPIELKIKKKNSNVVRNTIPSERVSEYFSGNVVQRGYPCCCIKLLMKSRVDYYKRLLRKSHRIQGLSIVASDNLEFIKLIFWLMLQM